LVLGALVPGQGPSRPRSSGAARSRECGGSVGAVAAQLAARRGRAEAAVEVAAAGRGSCWVLGVGEAPCWPGI
jgi:hypothetical protein